VHTAWSVGLFMNELALRSTRLYVVARHRGDVIGFGGVLFSGPDAHITTLSTDPAFHRRKVATRLLLVLTRAAIERGSQHLTLEVRASNEPAIALYRAFGLAPVGVRKNYYAELKEDALVMWAHEIDQPAYAERLDEIDGAIAGRTHVEALDW
jgi:[ribosomal protein S18]-alanine N-acetyltransferase